MTPDALNACFAVALHWMLIQHTIEFDSYHQADALSANFDAMLLLVQAGHWEWHPEAGKAVGRMCRARPKKGWPE